MKAKRTRDTDTTPPGASTEETLRRENEELRAKNAELLETLDAIRRGEVDAIVVAEDDQPRVYSLEGTEHPYRVLVERIQEGALSLTTTGLILFANDAFARMLSRPLSAVLGTMLADHLRPQDRERFGALLDRARTVACRADLTLCLGTGTLPASLSLTPIGTGDGMTIGAVVTDRRRDVGRLLLQSRMLDSVVDAVSAVGPDGRIIYWNRAAERLYGWTADEVIGQPLSGGAAGSGEPDGEEARQVFEMLKAGGTWSAEHMARHRDGRRFPVQGAKAPVYDEDGALVAIIGTSQDISERKRLDEELAETARAAELRAGELDAALMSIASGVIVYDASATILRMNEAAERMLGVSIGDLDREDYARRHEGLGVAKPDGTPLATEDAPYHRALQGEIIRGEEVVFTGVGGEPLYVVASASPIRDGEGRIAGAIAVFTDVSEHRRAAERLRESEELFRTAFETTPLGMVLGDLHGTVLESNTVLEEMLGYSKDALRGRAFAEFTHPDDVALEWPLIEPVLSGEAARYEIEKRYIRSDGGVIPVRLVGTVVRDGNGAIRSGLAIIEDITGRREAEQQLRYHANLVDTVTDAIISTDTDLVIRSWNPAAERIYGWRADEAIGRRGSDILGTEFPEGTDRESLIADLFGSGSWHGELVQRRKDGRPIHVEVTSIRLTDEAGATTGAVSVSRDVTERRRDEEALRRSEENLKLAQEAAHVGTTVWDQRTGALWWSEEQRRIFGLDPEGEVSFERYLSLVHPDDRAYVVAAIDEGLSTRRTKGMNYRIVRPDGKVRFIHGEGRIFHDGGTPSYIIGTVQDVTERREAEEALRKYAENLRRSNEDLERFAYVASHDLQEPLRSIVSFSQLLERRYRGKLGSDADEYIDFIVEGGNRMQTLILDLLAYSRVNSKAQELRPTDAEAVMAAVERHLDGQLREAGAIVTYDPLPTVLADPLQLEQVFVNLVSNAVKFRKAEELPRIHVSAWLLDGFWEFSVADNGIGFESEYCDQIFVIFQRLHTKDAYPGTGIGLAIVKRIVERHGGTVRVESTPGEGSTFFFTLPAA